MSARELPTTDATAFRLTPALPVDDGAGEEEPRPPEGCKARHRRALGELRRKCLCHFTRTEACR